MKTRRPYPDLTPVQEAALLEATTQRGQYHVKAFQSTRAEIAQQLFNLDLFEALKDPAGTYEITAEGRAVLVHLEQKRQRVSGGR